MLQKKDKWRERDHNSQWRDPSCGSWSPVAFLATGKGPQGGRVSGDKKGAPSVLNYPWLGLVTPPTMLWNDISTIAFKADGNNALDIVMLFATISRAGIPLKQEASL